MLRRFRVRLMSGDEAVFELDAAKCIRDLKRLIAGEQTLGAPPVARQRLVLMPEHGGREPHEVMVDGRALAQCGNAAGDETQLELVVVDAPAEVPVISEVRTLYLYSSLSRSPLLCCCNLRIFPFSCHCIVLFSGRMHDESGHNCASC